MDGLIDRSRPTGSRERASYHAGVGLGSKDFSLEEDDSLTHTLSQLVDSSKNETHIGFDQKKKETPVGESIVGIPRLRSVNGNQYHLWRNGVELYEDALRNNYFLPTGFNEIDTLLGGGLRRGQLTEIVGSSSSGKTQICLYVASHLARGDFGFVEFFDTSNSFSSSRVASIINQIFNPLDKEGHERDIKRIMSNICCLPVFDIFALFDALHELEYRLKKQMNSKDSKLCLLIVDSVSSLITPILGSNDSQGRALMVSTGYVLKKLAAEYNLCVLVTNHLVGGGGILKPAMGESWKCIPHVRLLISRDQGSSTCIISLLRHTSMACYRSTEFLIPS